MRFPGQWRPWVVDDRYYFTQIEMPEGDPLHDEPSRAKRGPYYMSVGQTEQAHSLGVVPVSQAALTLPRLVESFPGKGFRGTVTTYESRLPFDVVVGGASNVRRQIFAVTVPAL